MFKSKINILAISRGLPQVVAPIVPAEGNVFIFADLVQAEPTITLNYVYCKMLDYFTFSGLGKMPYYDGSRFMISDPYLALAGTVPTLMPKMKQLLKEGAFDAWTTDPDSVKSHKSIKAMRKMAKPASLGLAYGLGALPPRGRTEGGLIDLLRNAGYDTTAEEARGIYSAYWSVLYPELKQYKEALADKARNKEHLVNMMGFKLNPKKPSDAFNALIQSTVASLLDLCEDMLDEPLEALGGAFLLRIHDELVLEVPKEHAKFMCGKILDAGTDASNMLAFKYPVKFDPKIANNFYEGK